MNLYFLNYINIIWLGIIMRKLLLICSMGLLAFIITACSEEEKKIDYIGATDNCKAYFSEVDSLVTKASENPQTKAQLDSIKNQLEDGKKQIVALPKDQQDKACKQGIDAMKQIKQSLNMK